MTKDEFLTAAGGILTVGVITYGAYLGITYDDPAKNSTPPDAGITVAVGDNETPSADNPRNITPSPVIETSAPAIPVLRTPNVTPDMAPSQFAKDFESACDASIERNDKYARACSIALRLENLMGIDAFVLMGKLAMETGFRDVSGATHDAQGIWQLQVGYTVTNLRRYGQDLPFYKDLEDDAPLKLAIDKMVDDYDDGMHALNMEEQLEVYEETGKFTDPLAQAIHEFRYDDFKSGQLVVAFTNDYVPETHSDNFTASWEEDYQDRMSATLNAYAFHNMERTAHPIN